MLSPFLTLNCPCNEALLSTSESLRKTGLRVLQTFELHKVSQMLHECPCQHHTTIECDCQMVVLLVYGEGAEPATLILHGNNGTTWLSLPESFPPIDSKLSSKIRSTLEILAEAEQ